MRRISLYFFNGLMALLPLVITVWLLYTVFNFLDGILGGYITLLIGRHIPGLGLVVAFVFVIFFGYLATALFTRRLLRWGEALLYKLPVVNTVYSSVKQVNRLLFLQKKTKAFKRVCAVEYPRKGMYSIGFVTGEGLPELKRKRKDLINVFVPNSPTPATGFTVIVPKKDVVMLDMKIDDALKLVVSGGVLTPGGKVPKLIKQ